MARKKGLTRSGLPNHLSNTLRTVRLKELAEKRAKRLNILRKFIENISYNSDRFGDLSKNRLSIEEFAVKIDLKPGTWSRLERAESCVSIEAAMWISIKVLQAFNVFVTAEWLLGENDSDRLPRIIKTEKFDIYEYLQDVYKASEFGKQLNEEEFFTVHQMFVELEVANKVTDFSKLKAIVNRLDSDLLKNSEKIIFAEIEKNKDEALTENQVDLLRSVCRRLIISYKITDEEKSSRDVLAGFFMSDVFTKMNPNSLITYIRDNQMAPTFNKGQIVGGIKQDLDNLQKLEGKECIIELKNLLKVVRILHLSPEGLIIASPASPNHTPQIYRRSEIISISQISFTFNYLERESLKINLEDDSLQIINYEDIKT